MVKIKQAVAMLCVAFSTSVLAALPQAPSILRDVTLVDIGNPAVPNDQKFKRPYIPPVRTTLDGRIGMSPGKAAAGTVDGATLSCAAARTKVTLPHPAYVEKYMQVEVNQAGVFTTLAILASPVPSSTEFYLDADLCAAGSSASITFVNNSTFTQAELVHNDTASYWRIFLLAPEKYTQYFVNDTPTIAAPRIFADPHPGHAGQVLKFVAANTAGHYEAPQVWNVPGEVLIAKKLLHGSGHSNDVQNVFLCEPNPEQPLVDGETDKYLLYAITATHTPAQGGTPNLKLWRTPLTIRVANPKTANAYIASVELGIPQGANQTIKANTLSQPMVTGDGKLLVWRSAYQGFPVDGGNCTYGSATATCPYLDLVYSYNPGDACDINGWTDIHPVPHAYYDTVLNPSKTIIGDAKYGLAEFPMRDAGGIEYGDNRNLSAIYPWMDIEGNNLFFTTIKSTLFNQANTIPRIASDKTVATNEEASLTRGVAFIGRWSKGKLVLLDGMFNNADYGIAARDTHQLALYENQSVPVAAAVDFAGIPKTPQSILELQYPVGSLHNTVFISSIENLFNINRYLKPVTPHDVVWYISAGATTDEVAFDDYLNNKALIVSSMVGYLKDRGNDLPAPDRFLQSSHGYYDGSTIFNHATGAYAMANDYRNWNSSGNATSGRTIGFNANYARVQNAASSPDGNEMAAGLPPYGQLNVPADSINNGGRIEPVALGGVNGRGLWLEKNYAIKYTFSNNFTQDVSKLYVGFFVDLRACGSTCQLLGFPDGTRLQLSESAGQFTLKYASIVGSAITTEKTILLPSSFTLGKWHHLGFNISTEGSYRKIDFYLDGYLFKSEIVDNTIFMIMPGSLYLGAHSGGANGFKGWVDDFKVFAENVNTEVACNHANGTLVGIDASSGTHTINDGAAALGLQWLADRYGLAADERHQAITDLLRLHGKKTYAQYACYHDYSGDYKAHLGNIPLDKDSETASVREALLMPEGPVYHDVERPNFLASADDDPQPAEGANTFCLSCHIVTTNTEDKNPLSTAALYFERGLAAKFDKRRQPMQTIPRLYGVMPADTWLKETFSGTALPTKSYIDEWTLTHYKTGYANSDEDGDGLSNQLESDDKISDSQHKDTDSDGVCDGNGSGCSTLLRNDAFPSNASASVDTDADGKPDTCIGLCTGVLVLDDDDDNDGIIDTADAFPLDATELIDTDNDGTGNNSDTDDDNDGMPDIWEIQYGLNPLDASDANDDLDSDGISNLDEYNNGSNPTVPAPDNDFNNNGSADVLLRSTTSGNWQLFTMSNGVASSDNAYAAHATSDWQLVASEDFDADGDTDVLLRNTTSGLWRMFITNNGAVASDNVFDAYASVDWAVASVADYNGDGIKDILLHNTVGGSWRVFYINNGQVSGNANMALYATGWKLISDADLDGDGDADVLLRRTSDGYWRQFTSNGGVIAGNAAIGLYQNKDWKVQFTSDLDNDGDEDIVMRNTKSGFNWRTFEMQNGAVVGNTKLALTENEAWTFNHLNDVDNDGDEDIVLRKNTGQWRLFLTNGLNVGTKIAFDLNGNTSWVKADVLDLNGDGTKDVLLNNASTGAWRAFMISAGAITSDANPGLYQSTDWTLQDK